MMYMMYMVYIMYMMYMMYMIYMMYMMYMIYMMHMMYMMYMIYMMYMMYVMYMMYMLNTTDSLFKYPIKQTVAALCTIQGTTHCDKCFCWLEGLLAAMDTALPTQSVNH